MAFEYEFEFEADSGWNERGTRKCKMYFTEPEFKCETPPGILLLIAGYGGEANSNVYCKMRKVFADKYNLFVVQCNYLGWEFMQSSIDGRGILQLERRNDEFEAKANINEDNINYNEMGPFQMLDNIVCVKALVDIINANKMEFDEKRVGIYGHSHGGYLAHLCNCFFPYLFTDILDNSAWLFPAYLTDIRQGIVKVGKSTLNIFYDYEIKYKADDKEIYDLEVLYKQFFNKCNIVAFHGEEDSMVAYSTKKKLIESVNNARFKLIRVQDVDNVIFGSTEHGLSADFLKMFEYAVDELGVLNGEKEKGGDFTGNEFITSRYKYKSGMIADIPNLERIERFKEL